VGALEYAHGVAREASAEWKSMTLQDKAVGYNVRSNCNAHS
jgi:hypothetical protein